MDNKMKMALFLLAAAALFAGCVSPTGKAIAVGAEQPALGDRAAPSGQEDVSAAVDISAKSPLELEIGERLAASEKVKERRTSLPEIFYKNIPAFPDDFYRMRILVIYGKLNDLNLLDGKYWKQPEFIPGFEEHAVKLMNEPQAGRWGAFGYGTYPADTYVATSPGQEFEVVTFFHSGWLVETYQGVKFEAVFEENSTLPKQDLQSSTMISQDPEVAKESLEVVFSPGTMVLEPTYPILEYGWIQKLNMHVKVKEGTPPGDYVIGVNLASPPKEFNDQMFLKHLNYYTTSGSAVGVGRPFYQVAVTVK